MKKLYSTVITLVLIALIIAAAVEAAPRHFPSWDKKITGSGRFTVLNQFDGTAVFDKETGLVWEQSPDTITRSWFNALVHCYEKEVSGRKGWRLPTIEELASLVDTSQPAPKLPAGHPFSNVQSFFHWSATTDASFTSSAWGVFFDVGPVGIQVKADSFAVWCVRAGQGIDGVQ